MYVPQTLWTIVAGSACQISTNGLCIINGGGDVVDGSSQSCLVRSEVDMTLSVKSFALEASSACSDSFVSVAGKKYCGATGPDGVKLAVGGTMQFGYKSAAAFEICDGNLRPYLRSAMESQRRSLSEAGPWTITEQGNGDCEITGTPAPLGLCVSALLLFFLTLPYLTHRFSRGIRRPPLHRRRPWQLPKQ